MVAEKRVAEEVGGCKNERRFLMEIRQLENKKEENKLSFIIKDTTPAYANSLRRFMLEEVPVMAIEDIEFRKNSSILYDEIIGHRLGLIPLTTDLKSYNLPENCKCEGKGCARCQLSLTLKTKEAGIVYASQIKSKDPAIVPVFPKMPIVKLLKGQSLELEAKACLGQGKVHTKWSPGLIYYKQRPIIEINDSKIKDPGKVVEMCPKNVFEIKNDKLVVVKDSILDCHLCEACSDLVGKDAIKVSPSNDFIFYVESWGQLNCKQLVLEAIKLFNEQLGEFVSKIKELK
ncbi:MAG: DNA-directed RNA polymerase subunit D [Nanoarchaeota archaeon]